MRKHNHFNLKTEHCLKCGMSRHDIANRPNRACKAPTGRYAAIRRKSRQRHANMVRYNLLKFPRQHHDDMVDALAYSLQVARL